MSDMQPVPEPPPWARIPKDMNVNDSTPTVWATNVAPSGKTVWLWIRQPALCIAVPFTADNARGVAKALAEGAAFVDQVNPPEPKIEPVRAPLLGPNGAPL